MDKIICTQRHIFLALLGRLRSNHTHKCAKFQKIGDCTGEVLETPYLENGKLLDPSLPTLKEITARYAEVSILSDDINKYMEISLFLTIFGHFPISRQIVPEAFGRSYVYD